MKLDAWCGSLAKAKLKPPHTFKDAKIADEMARKACGLDVNEPAAQSILIHVNELIDGHEPEVLEANVVAAEVPPADGGLCLKTACSPDALPNGIRDEGQQ